MKTLKLLGVLLMGWALAFHGGAQQTADPADTVRVSIIAPTDGFITLSPTLTVQGTVQAPEGSKIDLVLVSVNGRTQKAELNPDGSFKAEIELEYFGENIVSATAITDAKQIGSARVSVNLQRRVLFFDDFEAGRPRPEWAPASGTWVATKDPERGWVYTLEEWKWDQRMFTYVATPDSLNWRDYAVEATVINGREAWGIGIVVRARDDLNKVLFAATRDWLCWIIIRDGHWSDCQSQVWPGLSNAPTTLRVEVRDHTYVAYVNGIKRTWWEDLNEQFPAGMPGLFMHHKQGSVGFDNVKVESLEAGPQSALAADKEMPPTPDWELIKTQLAQLQPRLQNLDTRLNTLQSDVGQIKIRLPRLPEGVTPSDLEALQDQVSSLEELLQRWGQHKRVETLQALLGEQMVKVKRLEGEMERMTEEFKEVRKRAESAEATAKAVDSKATLGLIAGVVGVALLILLEVVG